MMQSPTFFKAVRERASARWEQLERDPELAGPWHQLFKQVQSPRHVLSELLQNADDAGASEASAYIADDVFVFEHNGEDFTEEHFASLCRFGYSNKRSLHTIGFRGIGFKSTFSLGDQVDLFTPSLAVRFHRHRFTEPQWLPDPLDTSGRTIIRVAISDPHRRREIEKNLEEWLQSPVSLLFFSAIRRLHIGDRDLYWGSLGPGPLPDTEWMALHGQEDDAFLLIHSEAEPFPEEALNEIRQERLLGSGEVSDFPPCKVDVVLGSEGRLYVVLPTGVQTALPFACNAPFIQDPARLKIKDPETSPTNRWLLERTGRLAASAMLTWLDQAGVPVIERAPAYGLFPDVDRNDNSLEGVCGTIVEEAFAESIDGKSILLTHDGQVVPALQALSISREILTAWPPEQASAILDTGNRPAFCAEAKPGVLAKLQRWNVLEQIDRAKLLQVLESQHLPKPKTWGQLLNLWTFIAPDLTSYRQDVSAEKIRIVPVQGRDVLYAAAEVVRLGDKKLLQSEKDWAFLAEFLVVANPNWHRFLAEQRRNAEERDEPALRDGVAAAQAVLEKVGLDDASDVNAVVDRVATEFFSRDGVEIPDCVRLAQIAAALDVRTGGAFRFVTRDRRLKPPDQQVLFDDGGLEDLLPEAQKAQLLHSSYDGSFESCSREEWLQWVRSGRSGLSTFIPLAQSRVSAYGKRTIEQEAQRRGAEGGLSYPYVTNHFIVEDWNFDDSCWAHWDALAADDDHVWANIVTRILSQREAFWSRSMSARILQVATTGSTRTVTHKPLFPSWVLRLRELPCVPDTRGFLHRPSDLLRRTADTESLMDIEPFLHARLDTEGHRSLWDLLGVRTTPTGPDRLLDCLRAFSQAEKPPTHEVEKWYRRLDQFLDSCSTADAEKIRDAFASQRLIFSADGVWVTSSSVFLSPDEEDVPDAAVIRASLRELTLWRKIGVADRPTAELAIAWLKRLPSSEHLSPDDARRVRGMLGRHPIRIWEECGHWLNLAGQWAPVSDLSYALTMQFLVPWKHLHEWVKQKTADFQRLPLEITSNPTFSQLSPLAGHIEERTERGLITGEPSKKEWLATFGSELRRATFESDDETQRVQAIAVVLAQTSWCETPRLDVTPYIDGTPAGTPRQGDVVWLGRSLFVTTLPKAKLARRVPEEIGKTFSRPDIKAALDYGFERTAEDIREYLEENFSLGPHKDPRTDEVVAGNGDGHFRTSDLGVSAEDAATPQGSTESVVAPGEPMAEELGATEPVEQAVAANGAGDPTEAPRRNQRPVQPSLIELFASASGFRTDGADRFFHPDGSWIVRSHGSPFPWERHAASGELLRCYLPVGRCLQLEPLELDADVWALLDRRPSLYALILQHPDGTPVELAGTLLRSMRERGDLTLYPARYRLVQESREERHEA